MGSSHHQPVASHTTVVRDPNTGRPHVLSSGKPLTPQQWAPREELFLQQKLRRPVARQRAQFPRLVH